MNRMVTCVAVLCVGLSALAVGVRDNFEGVVTRVEARTADGRDNRDDRYRCTLRSLRGTYGVIASGAVTAPAPVPPGPFATVGRMVIDDEGAAVFNATRSFNGTIIPEVDLAGTLTIDEECRGAALFTNGRAFDFVVVDKGREMYWIQTNAGATVTVTLKRQD